MEKLIDDLLAYSRLSRAELTLRAVDLGAVLRKSVEDVRSSNPTAVIEASNAVPPVIGDTAVLLQVMTNLISNAAKFVRPGQHPAIRVQAASEDGTVLIRVEDDGIGIAPEHHERIFRVFERLHGQESYPGTGVGLAIVRKGVERLGGTCGLSSTPGKGSSFWIRLQSAWESHAG